MLVRLRSLISSACVSREPVQADAGDDKVGDGVAASCTDRVSSNLERKLQNPARVKPLSACGNVV